MRIKHSYLIRKRYFSNKYESLKFFHFNEKQLFMTQLNISKVKKNIQISKTNGFKLMEKTSYSMVI